MGDGGAQCAGEAPPGQRSFKARARARSRRLDARTRRRSLPPWNQHLHKWRCNTWCPAEPCTYRVDVHTSSVRRLPWDSSLLRGDGECSRKAQFLDARRGGADMPGAISIVPGTIRNGWNCDPDHSKSQTGIRRNRPVCRDNWPRFPGRAATRPGAFVTRRRKSCRKFATWQFRWV